MKLSAKGTWPTRHTVACLAILLLLVAEGRCQGSNAALERPSQGEMGGTMRQHMSVHQSVLSVGGEGEAQRRMLKGAGPEHLPFGGFPAYTPRDDSTTHFHEPEFPHWLDNVTMLEMEEGARRGPARNSSASSSVRGRSLKLASVYKSCQIWVAKTGSANFRSIQEAVNSIPNGNTVRKYICVMPGVYKGQVTIPHGKDFITLLGYGRGTILTASNGQSVTGNPYFAATLVVWARRFVAMALVVQNTRYTTWDPAPAVALLNTQSQFLVVGMKGWMDTLAIWTGAHYFQSCYIDGKTDFIWGFGRAYFKKCELFDKFILGYTGFYTAAGVDAQGGAQPGGFVFDNCKVQGDGKAYLGRPYRDRSLVAFIGCYMGENVLPVGWSDWEGRFKGGRVTNYEIGSSGPGFSKASRRMCNLISGDTPVPQKFSAEAWIQLSSWLYG